MAIPVERIVQLEYNAMRVSAEYLADIYTLTIQGKAAGLFTVETLAIDLVDGSVGTRIIFRFPDGRPDLVAYQTIGSSHRSNWPSSLHRAGSCYRIP